ncbi:MAG TPA: AAA family ATPase [bacterium]|nr:AAA family ATPase [bacterium]
MSHALIQALQDPALFDHPVTGFAVIETHISWVLLTGPFAYKIKKPVNLGFCDFTSLEKRKFFCEEELRLNRRLAPELYAGVVPITGMESAPRLGGAGAAIEYAVKMVEFDQSCRLDRVLSSGRLEAGQIDQLARELAEFHASIPAAAPEASYGRPEAVIQAVRGTLAHCESSGLAGWCEAEARHLEPVFEARKASGFVREAHGDVHLANVAVVDGRVRIFDAIDFNPELRWIDVMSEIAFAVMDLEDRGRSDLAFRLLNAYLEGTGDYEGLRVFRFYEVYRALVRAKVAAIRLSQPDLPETDREEIRREADGYLGLARRFTRTNPPGLMITHGISGSGKTYGTQKILEEEGCIRLRTDVERKRLFGLKADEPSPPSQRAEVYGPDATRRVYRKLLDLSWMILGAGFSVIVDGTFLRRGERDEFRALAESLAVPFTILVFEATEEVLKERVASRKDEGRDASEADWDVVAKQREWRQPLAADEWPSARRTSPIT